MAVFPEQQYWQASRLDQTLMGSVCRTIKACLKLLCFVITSLILIPPQVFVLSLTKGKKAYIIPCIWHKLVCRCFGISVCLEGLPARKSQVVYVGNHLSYLDIPVIGSAIKASFISKKDVAFWSEFGFLLWLQQTALVQRQRSSLVDEQNSLDNFLNKGKSLIIFPEGTSTDGRTVLPFKSSLFSLMLREGGKDLLIQPFTMILDRVEGQRPETQTLRDIYAWHNKMDAALPAHLWHFSKSNGARIILKFHEPIKAKNYKDRKALAKICQEKVAEGLESSSDLRKVA